MPAPEWTATAEERAGQHIMAGFTGIEAPAALLARIREGRLGGIVLFKRNIESAAQLHHLTESLQAAARASRLQTPLLISIDEEGGRVSRVSPDFFQLPPAQALGRIGDLELTERAARAIGAELRAVGINMNFAPVLDQLTNPACTVIGDRAFGNEPTIVGKMGAAFIAGLQAEGVAATAKHFPGIGGMAPDPHEVLPASPLSLEELLERELLPFIAAWTPGITKSPAAAVMIAHAVFEKIGPARPASLSPAIAGALLRDRLQYGGLAVTDDLEMGAIEDAAGGAVSAIAAGVDIALICQSGEVQEKALESLAAAIRSGHIPEAAEKRSRERIFAVKERYIFSGERGSSGTAGDMRPVNSAHRTLEREINQRLEDVTP